ncbi:MAG TPA: glycogen/starch synthase [bacterium]|nr:glycogen/starch synthase [bacterium]
MRILMMTAELRDLVSIGGLAEAVASLATALHSDGHDVRIALPYYTYIQRNYLKQRSPKLVWEGDLQPGALPEGEVYRVNYQWKHTQLPLYLMRGHPWFDQADTLDHVYPPPNAPQPYFFFAAATLQFLADTGTDWTPDVIHCHDYHAGLLPVYLKTRYQGTLKNKKVATVFTIHNLAYQGRTDSKILRYGGLPESLAEYQPDLSGMEYYGDVNCLKGALVYADICTTVSNTYTQEIQSESYGEGLDGVLRALANHDRLIGIVNGIDHYQWNPQNLGQLSYGTSHLSTKDRIKQLVRLMTGLELSPDPVIAIRSRWGYQKGWDFIVNALKKHTLYNLAQFLIVTRGQSQTNSKYRELWNELKTLAHTHEHRIALISNDNPVSYLQYAGSDMLLMPSMYEPCGLTQMEAMRYGVIPVARKTGGIADTVDNRCGFLFDWEPQPPLDEKQIITGTRMMTATLIRALEHYRTPEIWHRLRRNAMGRQNSWTDRIPEYEQVYQAALSSHGETRSDAFVTPVVKKYTRAFNGSPVLLPYAEFPMPIPEKGVLWQSYHKQGG